MLPLQIFINHIGKMNAHREHTPFFRTACIAILMTLLSAGTVHAQFTIRKPAEASPQAPRVFDGTPRVHPKNVYFDPAAARAEKLRLRKERNTVEFNASLETSLQQFENWTGSGSNNFYALANLFFRHQYQKEKLSIDYRVDATYGMNFIDEAFFKNKDEFKISWQLGWTMHNSWSYSASANIRSQFTTGYKSRTERIVVSDFMSPGYFDLAGGFTYSRVGSPFKITLSPVGGNIVTVLDNRLSEEGAYGVKAGEKVSGKLGYSADIYFDRAFGRKEWMRYRSNLYAFMPYTEIDNPTIRWENTLEFRLTRFISTKLYGQLYYRKEDSSSIQYQYSFMIGLKYVFRNK